MEKGILGNSEFADLSIKLIEETLHITQKPKCLQKKYQQNYESDEDRSNGGLDLTD